MKKKLLLFVVMIIAAVSVFVIAASALTDIPEFTEIIDVTKISDKVQNPIDISSLASQVQGDNESRVLLRDENGNYQTYLTKYITQFGGGYGDGSQFVAYFYALNNATGKNYDVTSIVCIEIPEGTQRISNTYSKTSTWTNVMYVKAPSTLIYQQAKSYNSCSNIKVIDYSKASITNLEQEFITNNSSIEVVYFPASVQVIGKWAIHGTRSLSSAYIPASLQSAEGMLNSTTGSGKFVFFYTGGIASGAEHTALYTILGNTSVKEIAWDSSKNDSYYIEQAKSDSIYIVYNYNHCKAFNNNIHDYEGTGNCLEGVECTQCHDRIESFTEHKMVETLVYANGFTGAGIYNKFCANASDCTANKISNVEKPAIFVMNEYNGFSESGKDGIAFGGYCLNATALDEYNRVNKDAPVKYGVVLINPDYLDGKDSFFKDGKVNSTVENKGFLQTDMSSARYANISISVTGFTGDAENLSLILAIYAYTDANDVEFIQSQTTECASKRVTLGETSLYTVTLASVKAGNSNLSDLGDYVMPSKRED